MAQDHEKKETKPDEDRTDEINAYLKLPVREQQIQQMDDFISGLLEETKEKNVHPFNDVQPFAMEYIANVHPFNDVQPFAMEYIALASAMFTEEVSLMLYLLEKNVKCEESFIESAYAMIKLIEACKVLPEFMLSGEYPGGGVITQSVG